MLFRKKKLFSPHCKDRETGISSLLPLFHILPQTDDLAFNLSHSFTSFHTFAVYNPVSIATHWGICINLLSDLTKLLVHSIHS